MNWQVKNELSTVTLNFESMINAYPLTERWQLEAEVLQLRTQIVQKEYETDKLKKAMISPSEERERLTFLVKGFFVLMFYMRQFRN